MVKMVPKKASKKRQRDESSESEAEQVTKQTVPASSGASDESDEDSSSSDDETEHVLFRPAPVRQPESDDEVDDDSEEESDEEENKPVTKATKVEASSKKTTTSSSAPSDAAAKALEEEAARKTEATVYVEGIPYKADEGDIVSHFSSCGIVKEVRMPRYQDSGKPRGYAHVVFESASSIPKALKLDGKYLFGRYLTVKQAERPRTVETAIAEQKNVKKAVKGCRTVFIKHLPYDIEESTIREALASCGTISSVRLPLWNHTKKLKGFGYVEFANEEEALAAAKRSGMKIGDRMVVISLETPGSAPKASFRLPDGRFWNKGEDAKQSLAKKLQEKSQRASDKKAATKKPRTK